MISQEGKRFELHFCINNKKTFLLDGQTYSQRQVIIRFIMKYSWIYDKPAKIPSGGFKVSSLTQKEINITFYTDLEAYM